MQDPALIPELQASRLLTAPPTSIHLTARGPFFFPNMPTHVKTGMPDVFPDFAPFHCYNGVHTDRLRLAGMPPQRRQSSRAHLFSYVKAAPAHYHACCSSLAHIAAPTRHMHVPVLGAETRTHIHMRAAEGGTPTSCHHRPACLPATSLPLFLPPKSSCTLPVPSCTPSPMPTSQSLPPNPSLPSLFLRPAYGLPTTRCARCAAVHQTPCR